MIFVDHLNVVKAREQARRRAELGIILNEGGCREREVGRGVGGRERRETIDRRAGVEDQISQNRNSDPFIIQFVLAPGTG